MARFVFLSLIFMGWAFYELSGGNDFTPPSAKNGDQRAQVQATPGGAADKVATVFSTQPAAEGDVATRANTGAGLGDIKIAVTQSTVSDDVAAPQSGADVAPDLTEIGKGRLKIFALDAPKRAAIAAPADTKTDARPDPVAEQVAGIELRQVTGNRVNMRNGPGTGYSVMARLERGMIVEVLQEPGNGWVKLRVNDTGRVGWMADFLLASAE